MEIFITISLEQSGVNTQDWGMEERTLLSWGEGRKSSNWSNLLNKDTFYVLVCQDCHNQVPWELKPSRGWKSKIKVWTGFFFCGFSPWLVEGHLLPVSPHGVSSVWSCLCPNVPLLCGYQSYWTRAHPYDLILPYLPLPRPFRQIQSPSEEFEGRGNSALTLCHIKLLEYSTEVTPYWSKWPFVRLKNLLPCHTGSQVGLCSVFIIKSGALALHLSLGVTFST